VEDDHPSAETLESREPTVEDLVELCRHLNSKRAKYLVIGGFAIRAAGYDRRTMDIDLLIDTALENEAKVFDALAYLPDQAVRELEPGEVAKYVVVRVADEIVVDLMRSASGIDYDEASRDAVTHEVDGVAIPFASPRLLWKMKRSTGRDKDLPDLNFLRYLFRQTNEDPDA
jgi:hypothetical protein